MFRKAVKRKKRGAGGLWEKRRERGKHGALKRQEGHPQPLSGARPAPGIPASPAITALSTGLRAAGSAGLAAPGDAAGTRAGADVPGAGFQQRASAASSLHGDAGGRFSQGPSAGPEEPAPWDLPTLGAKSRLCVPQDAELCFSLKAPGKDGPSPLVSPLPLKKFAPKIQTV